MQPPEPIEHYPAESVPVTWESLLAWRTSEGFERTRTILTQYPKEALLGLESRLLLYHLIRSTKPMTVVEIGTYFAGTAELMTRALWENGKGGLTTVDPFGGQRCQAIIDTWPEPLRKHVQFAALDSMQLMIAVEHQRTLIDFAFVDGNHEYEYAYFDIANCARFMRPGGFIVVDDVGRSGHSSRSATFSPVPPVGPRWDSRLNGTTRATHLIWIGVPRSKVRPSHSSRRRRSGSVASRIPPVL